MSPLFRFRMAFGLRWKKSLPWEEIIDHLVTVILAIAGALALLTLMAWLDAREQIASERIKTSQHEQMLNDCLESRAVFEVNGNLGRCRVEWVK